MILSHATIQVSFPQDIAESGEVAMAPFSLHFLPAVAGADDEETIAPKNAKGHKNGIYNKPV